MKEFIKDIFPKIIRYSNTLDDLTVLTNIPWVLMSEDNLVREVWIFRSNNDLIVSKNGVASTGTWDYIKEANSLIIEVGEVRRLINRLFVDDVTLLLKLEGDQEVIALANENKIKKDFIMSDYLKENYNQLPPYQRVNLNDENSKKKHSIYTHIKLTKSEIQINLVVLILGFLIEVVLAFVIISGVKDDDNTYLIGACFLLLFMIFIFWNYMGLRKEMKKLVESKRKIDDSES